MFIIKNLEGLNERQKLRTVRGAKRRVSAVLANDADF